jgi:hypothetical protein
MNSMPLILARLTVSGLAILDFLILWLFGRGIIGFVGIARRRNTTVVTERRHPLPPQLHAPATVAKLWQNYRVRSGL